MSENKLSLSNLTSGVGAVEPTVVEQTVEGPSWSAEFPIEGPPEEMQLVIGVQCRNMPVGSKFQFSIPAGTTKEGKQWEGVDSGQQTIQNPNQSLGYAVTWPAGVETVMTISWWAEGKTPEPGAALEPFIGIVGAGLQVQFA